MVKSNVKHASISHDSAMKIEMICSEAQSTQPSTENSTLSNLSKFQKFMKSSRGSQIKQKDASYSTDSICVSNEVMVPTT